MAKAKKQFEWKENMACVATYKILEGDKFLDQFEDADIAFKDAGDVKLGTLSYFPRTTTNAEIIDLAGLEMSRMFFKHLSKTFTIKKEDAQDESAAIILAVGAVFKDPEKTIKDLAQVVDDRIKFPDE